MRFSKLCLLAVVVAGLAACGNSIESKQDAAAAVQRLAFATSKAAVQPQPSGAAIETISVTVQGKAGSATVRFSADDSGNATAQIAYDEFSADGVNTFDGDLTASMSIDLSNLLQGMSVSLSMNGAVEMSGDYDSSLQIDLTASMAVGELENTSGASVSIRLDGRVVADGEEYLFADESITVQTTER